ncbi:MAG: MBL fold metallo-hydrolase [Candidatus Aminicenantes bacterium]|nr:MBL fold metallo-hydrolase [Candidatus Aminicenantes bacterium]
MKITFLGACRQVTGSAFLVETEGKRLLVDCGLYQERPYLERNWHPFPIEPTSIEAIILTHVHLDHSGLLPKIVKEGFNGPIYMTPITADLLPIVLLDAAHLQEEDAAFKRKRHQREGRKGPYPEIPLYTEQEARRVFSMIKKVNYREKIKLGRNLNFILHDAGHILGSAMVEISIQQSGREKNIIFTGDIGQRNKPLVKEPSIFERADFVLMEATYGDKNHEDPEDIPTMLTRIINETVMAGGNLVIPIFAIERAQEVLFYLSSLTREKKIPPLLCFLDSPMALEVTQVFEKHQESFDEETLALYRSHQDPFHFPGLKMIRTINESKAINKIRGSCIIMAGSGMCTGGRIKHHLVHNIARPESTILFVGYQAKGTLGRQILDGQSEVRILGQFYPVRARIEQIQSFSAHADRQSLLGWLAAFKEPPEKIFLIHGEEETLENFAQAIVAQFPSVLVPHYQQVVELD